MEHLSVVTRAVDPRVLFPINDLVISLFKECTPKILVYADGLTFDGGDFGLSDFINTLENTAIHSMMPIVETAHKNAATADHPSFTFTTSTLSKNKYDVLFLFGSVSSGTLPAGEMAAITQFMDDGGGVFATGDHANLGKWLCGEIPRVKEMRRWAGPTAGGTDRISTNDPGTDNAFQFNDQSDTIAQKIYPAYTGTTASSEPHYLLQHASKKIIEVLPDHPHESECTIPPSLADVSVWPKDSGGNDVSPEVVALSVSYGGGFTGKQPISVPRSFNAIVAYDGHKANVGRISTDATWHHFININLIPSSAGPGLAGNADVYDRVNTYFGNIAKWLMPKKSRRCLRWPFVLTVKEFYPIAEFVIDLPDRPGLPDLLEMGREMDATLLRFMTPGQRKEIVDDLLALHSEELLQTIDTISHEPKNIQEQIGQRTAPMELLEQVALGAFADAVARAIPNGENDLQANLKSIGGVDGLEASVKKSLKNALTELAGAIHESRSGIDVVLSHCH